MPQQIAELEQEREGLEQENWLKPPSAKGVKLLEVCRQKKLVLASGPRLSGKTISCLLAICDHAWNVRRANIDMITVSQSVGLDSGIWNDLIEIIPKFGLKWAKKPYVQAISKKSCLKVFNKFGDEVTIQLDSLKNEDEVESRFKSRRFSMIFVTELSNFRRAATFKTWRECLRGLGVRECDFLFLADTNPSDEGDKSWIYEKWYVLRAAEYPNYKPEQQAEKDALGLVEFEIADNTFDTKERIAELKANYADDPDLYARYIEGKWVTASEDALFRRVFKPNIHVIGEPESKANPDPELMVPEDNCFELGGGWDMGVVNSAFAICEKTFQMRDGISVPIFKALDELVIVAGDFEMGDFVREAMRKMNYWEEYLEKEVMWIHWSDRSAFDMREPISNLYHHQAVAMESAGTIILQAATGGKRTNETVRQRVDLLRKLLFQDRIFISGNRCPHMIEMIKSIKKGRGALSVIQKESPHKHIFDALTYYLSSECLDELNRAAINAVRPKNYESGVVSISI